MATKDWKKTRDDMTGVNFHKITNKGMIGKLTRRIDLSLREYEKNKWMIAVGNWSGSSGLKIIKQNIKTKSAALKYAKAYMRKH